MQGILHNRYQIKNVLGQGGMGTVYMGEDLHLNNRRCVIKQLRDDFYRDEDRQKAVSFFEREAGMLINLEHPNIVKISDRFTQDGKYFLVMEYVEGEDFHNIMQRREGEPYSENQVVSWAIEICDVLDFLHGQNPPVIYRDLKPSNIMLNTKGQIKLVDFGIARHVEEEHENTHVVSAGYSPPEQYWGGANPKSDIYALGATMHFLLTGKDPEPLKPSSPKTLNPDVSDYLDELVRKTTAQEPTSRFESVQELREALLHDGYEEEPDNPKSWFTQTVAAVVFVIAFALVFIGWEPIMNAFKPEKTNDSKAAKAPAGLLQVNDTRGNTGVDPLFGGATPQRGFALQLNDEKDLTDPSALKESRSDSAQSK